MIIPGSGYGGLVALYVALVCAGVAAALVYFGVEAEPIMALPVIITMLPFIARSFRQARVLRITSVVLLGTFAVLGILSVGFLFLPSVIALAIATAQVRPAKA